MYTYDAVGRLDTITSPLDLVTTYQAYDAVHTRLPQTIEYAEPASISLPDGTTITGRSWQTDFTYDTFGYVDTITTTESGETVSIVDYDYDQLGRLTRYELKETTSGTPLRKESYSYDSLGTRDLQDRRAGNRDHHGLRHRWDG